MEVFDDFTANKINQLKNAKLYLNNRYNVHTYFKDNSRT